MEISSPTQAGGTTACLPNSLLGLSISSFLLLELIRVFFNIMPFNGQKTMLATRNFIHFEDDNFFGGSFILVCNIVDGLVKFEWK